jgi:hypothetical protein
MAMFDQTAASNILALILNDTAFSAVTATNILLGTTTPSATADMTQLGGGSGYTTGGSSIIWNAVSLAATSNSNAISWTNSGGSWTLAGLEIWNSGATVRYLFGTWTGQPITVATGNTFTVAPAGITVNLVLGNFRLISRKVT